MYGDNIYGNTKYAINTNNEEESICSPDLMRYLPTYYKNSKVMKNILCANSKEIGRIECSQKDLLNQFFIDTATWGLNLWEKEYGIITDLNKSYEERREIIKAKKRGQGTITKKLLKDTAEAFSGGECEILEHPESYSFTVQFIGIKGIPKNLAGFKDMLDTIKPAHLAYDFKYTYTVWDFLKDKSLTWGNAKLKTWNDLKIYE